MVMLGEHISIYPVSEDREIRGDKNICTSLCSAWETSTSGGRRSLSGRVEIRERNGVGAPCDVPSGEAR